ncbi:hypothetical protein GCM10010869_06350 [Mesorhizobium tianshanense]|nr:hypothetical protein GCM10010869_06350 [Mesorhizobium tianshanense]
MTCDEKTVREWTSYMRDHGDEVSLALRNEGVRHEMWFMGHDSSLFVIGVMDVDDIAASRAVAAKSELSVDEVHRRFKRSWDARSIEALCIDRASAPHFKECELLFEARP